MLPLTELVLRFFAPLQSLIDHVFGNFSDGATLGKKLATEERVNMTNRDTVRQARDRSRDQMNLLRRHSKASE
jgi:hypothetical protein